MASNSEQLDSFVQELQGAAGAKLQSVVLYGADVTGDDYSAVDDLYVLIVLADLELQTLRAIQKPLNSWLRAKHPMPRLFTPKDLRASTDVFPIELSDITAQHRVLHGNSPFGKTHVDPKDLRLQCEREMREKLMRLQEAYATCKGKDSELRQLMAQSYVAFARVFRGVLRFKGVDVPPNPRDAVLAFCQLLQIATLPFEHADDVARGKTLPQGIDEAFTRYYVELVKAVDAVDDLGEMS